jgi:hypothetical protein
MSQRQNTTIPNDLVMGGHMNQSTSIAPDRLWQGVLGALLLVLVMFSEAIIGSDQELPAPAAATQACEHCNQTALAGH